MNPTVLLPDPHDPFWSKNLYSPPAEGVDQATINAMDSCAEKRDWVQYILFARQAGSLCPSRPKSESTLDLPFFTVFFDMEFSVSPLQRALNLAVDEASCDEILSGLLPHLPPKPRQELVDTLLYDCTGVLCSNASTRLIAPLLRAGAQPIFVAGSAARSGNVEALAILLQHGLSPDSEAPGEMPLILEALSKDRLYSSSAKMACARMLWEHGASLEKLFSSTSGPSCLLDMAVAEVDPLWESNFPGQHKRWQSFVFPWAYFEESGIPASALLPPCNHDASNARIATLLDPATQGPVKHGGVFDDDGSDGPPQPRTNPWIKMSQNYSWLASALEIATLRMLPAGLLSVRRPSI